jgi:hypothetical protein
LKTLFPQKLYDVSFPNPTSQVLLKVMLRCVNDYVMIIKPGHHTTVDERVIWSDESSLTLFPTSGRVYVWRTPMEAGSNTEIRGRFWMIWAAITWYSLGTIITLHGRITAREYVDTLRNQVQLMIQKLFPNNDAVFQDESTPIHIAGSVQSWFEEHEDECLHLPWPA